MDRARQAGSSGDSEVFLASSAYPRRDGMVCAFHLCVGKHETPVRFVEAHGIEGDRYKVAAHYATVSGQRNTHHPLCKLVSEFDDAAGRMETLKQAVLAGKAILINLNMNPDAPKQKKPKWARSEETEYDRWCRQHEAKYHSISVRSEEDYRHVMKTVHDHGGYKAVEKTMIGYRGKIRTYAEFDIGDDTNKLIGLLETMAEGERVLSKSQDRNNPGIVYVDAFPVRLTLQPGEKIQKSRNSNTLTINARPIFPENKNVVVEIAPRLSLCCGTAENDIAEKILHGTKTSAILFPSQMQHVLIDFRNDFSAVSQGATPEKKGKIKTSLRLTAFVPNQITIIGTKESAALPPPELPADAPITARIVDVIQAKPEVITDPSFLSATPVNDETIAPKDAEPITTLPHSLAPLGVEEILVLTPYEPPVKKSAAVKPSAPRKRAAGHDVVNDEQPVFDFIKPGNEPV